MPVRPLLSWVFKGRGTLLEVIDWLTPGRWLTYWAYLIHKNRQTYFGAKWSPEIDFYTYGKIMHENISFQIIVKWLNYWTIWEGTIGYEPEGI